MISYITIERLLDVSIAALEAGVPLNGREWNEIGPLAGRFGQGVDRRIADIRELIIEKQGDWSHPLISA